MAEPRHFLDLDRLDQPTLRRILDLGHAYKRGKDRPKLMADVMTLEERKGGAAGKVVAWTGDGNNVAASWVHAAARFDFELRLACPPELRPPAKLLEWARREGGRVTLTDDPAEAAAGADCVVT